MPNDEHVLRLKRIRGDFTTERRAVVAQYRVASNPLDVVAKIVLFQTEIDAIDRELRPFEAAGVIFLENGEGPGVKLRNDHKRRGNH
jgi:hypothetical protein